MTHIRGPLLEETHYYLFGLAMAGISSKAVAFGDPANKKKYNGMEYENSFDVNIGEAFYRSHDPQLGRWWQVDPKIDSMYQWSPYNAMFDNPIRYMDPLGDSSKPQQSQQAYFPAPKNGLPAYPNAGKGIYNPESGRWRWKQPDGTILEWDKKKGEVEKYDKSGKNHQGGFNPNTGEQTSPAKPERTTPKFTGNNNFLDPSGSQTQMNPSHNNPSQPLNTKDAAKAATLGLGVYLLIKVIEVGVTIGTGGAAAPVLAF